MYNNILPHTLSMPDFALVFPIRRLVIESGWESWRWSFRVSAEGMCEGKFAHSSIG